MKIVFDIETNGLDPDKIWMVACESLDGRKWFFTDDEDGFPPLAGFTTVLNAADTLIGHNIISYDLPVLKKLTGWEPASSQKIVDTMLLSQLNDFDRPQFEPYLKSKFGGRHNMKIWSKYLGGEEKHEDPSWLEYSVEMRKRCVSDVSINVQMYRFMLHEAKQIISQSPDYPRAIRLEHEVARAMADQEQNGWYFDADEANKLLRQINKRMAEIELEVEPNLKPRTVILDKEPREPKLLKNGSWDRITRDNFSGCDVGGAYQRFDIRSTDLGSTDAVIELLLREGWKPTEWNWKKNERGAWEKRSPKLTEDSYDSITGNLGQLVGEWRTLRSRRGLLEGLLKNRRPDGRIACRAFVIGTNTFRMRHAGIVNIPGAKALLGKEVRELFSSEPGRKIVSCDSDSNQLRAMAHYVNNPEVSAAISDGNSEDGTDIHSRNAAIVGVPRPVVKTITYAMMFGAGDAKLGESAGMKGKGKEVRARMQEALYGLKEITDQIGYEWEVNLTRDGRGWVRGLDGRRVFCEKFKAFNALLQCYEAVTCKAAVAYIHNQVKLRGLDAKIVCMMHDEVSLDVAEADAAEVAEIMEYAFGRFTTEQYSTNIPMGGSAAIGSNWYEVH